MGDFPFPKSFHLRRPADFRRVYSRGVKRHTGSFIVFRTGNDSDHPRLGLSVGKKYGNAVRRNRVKRLIREAVRLNWRKWNLASSDLVIIAKRGSGRFRMSDVADDLSRSFGPRAGGK
jgi:ribonuclease P protein component